MPTGGSTNRSSEHNHQQFDQNFKALISDVEILPRLIGWLFEELEDVPIEVIKDSLDVIEDGNIVRGRLTESNSIEHGKVIFDTLFDIHATRFGEEVDWIMGIEGQGRRGNNLEKRMQYYLARMMNDQKLQDFSNDDYGSLSKCVSTWIVMNPKRGYDDTIIRYRMTGEYYRGCECDNPVPSCGDLEIMVINLGRNGKNRAKVLGFLDLLFSRDMPVEDRRELLEKDYSYL